ncbi:unnamed protein product, partial [Rotaria sp. Silwood1]
LRSDFSFASYRSDYIYFSLINILGGCINCLSINILGDSGRYSLIINLGGSIGFDC